MTRTHTLPADDRRRAYLVTDEERLTILDALEEASYNLEGRLDGDRDKIIEWEKRLAAARKALRA